MSQNPGPTRRQRAERTSQLRQRGFTWDQIAQVWMADYPDSTPRRAYRWAHNLTHEEVADRWNEIDPGEPTMAKGRIYQFEVWPTGGRRPTPYNLEIMARIYQTSAHALLTDNEYDLYSATARAQIKEDDPLRGKQPLTVDQVMEISDRLDIPLHMIQLGSRGDDDQTKRRDFSKSLVLAAIGVTSVSRPAAVDGSTAANLMTITGAQRRLEATTPSRELAQAAVAHVDMAKRTLARTGQSPFADEVCAAVSEAAGFAAWLHADMHDTGTARTYYRLAIDAAVKADHDLLAAYMIGSLASFEIEGEDSHVGLALLADARRRLGDHPPPIANAWLSSIEALGHAAAHAPSSASAALHEAEQAVQASERASVPPWPWVFPFDQPKLAGYRALVMVRLGRHQEAVSAFAESLATAQPAIKQRAVLMTEIATARCIAREYDEALHLAEEALKVGVAHRSERVIQRARRFRRDYTGPLTSHVRAFDDRLRATLL
ncbi:tetratricopeptide repeat protein [Sphaerisporangium sp. NPDC051017]|uniref:tetratricopeptide repeat protein n=1 Tax=Sphaerisporangium sp. NPDC051017 TaxID=3154636 RepID=UPI00342639B2